MSLRDLARDLHAVCAPFVFGIPGGGPSLALMDGLERGDRIQQQQQYVFQRRDIGKFAQDVFLRYED